MKTVKLTLSMRRKVDRHFKYERKKVKIDLPDEVADNLESRQGRSPYVEGRYHTNRGERPIAELAQICAKIHGYEEGIFEFAEIVGDSAE